MLRIFKLVVCVLLSCALGWCSFPHPLRACDGYATSYDGLYLCMIADDHSLKVFDVVNFGNVSYNALCDYMYVCVYT